MSGQTLGVPVVRRIDGGVTTPAGFEAAGVACGIKRRPASAASAPLVVASGGAPVPAAAVFTVNKAVAAPVVVSRGHLQRSGGLAQAVVINSGCANACTGEAGMVVAHEMAAATAAAVGCQPEQVLLA